MEDNINKKSGSSNKLIFEPSDGFKSRAFIKSLSKSKNPIKNSLKTQTNFGIKQLIISFSSKNGITPLGSTILTKKRLSGLKVAS